MNYNVFLNHNARSYYSKLIKYNNVCVFVVDCFPTLSNLLFPLVLIAIIQFTTYGTYVTGRLEVRKLALYAIIMLSVDLKVETSLCYHQPVPWFLLESFKNI